MDMWFYSDGHWTLGKGHITGWWVCGELLCYTLALQVMAMEAQEDNANGSL